MNFAVYVPKEEIGEHRPAHDEAPALLPVPEALPELHLPDPGIMVQVPDARPPCKPSFLGTVCQHLTQALKRNLRAVAESAWQYQARSLDSVVEYVDRMFGHGVSGLAFIQRASYDATPCEACVAHGAEEPNEKAKSKLFAVQRKWMALLQLDPSISGDAVADDPAPKAFLALRGTFSDGARVVDRETGEGTRNVLHSVEHVPPRVHSVFSRVCRIAETDELGSNGKAERLLQETRHAKWKDSAIHSLCMGHKAHNAAEKTWLIASDLFSKMVHTNKTLHENGALMRAARQWMQAEIPRRLQITHTGVPPPDSVTFRDHALKSFLPPLGAPRRRAQAFHALKLLNGDWLARGCLRHCCSVGCCGLTGHAKCHSLA